MEPRPALATLWLMILSSGFVNGELSEKKCSWCEAGACNLSCSKVLDTFKVGISPQVGGRAMPYWRTNGMPSLGAVAPAAENIDMAVIVHHGSARNADEYFCYMQNAVIAAGRAETTLVLAPQIFEAGDKGLDESAHIWWDSGSSAPLGNRNWKWGGNSTQHLPESISSFEALDEMVATLVRRDLYPKLRKITFAGHSAGGQIIQRYALFNRIDRPGMNITFEYYPANPSSITYLDDRRPVLEARTCDTRCVNTSILKRQWTFEKPSNIDCQSSYDKYGYGIDGVLPDYPTRTTKGVAIEQYAKRSVVYLSGESDVCDKIYMTQHHCTSCTPDDGGLDGSCEAMTQGWCRMERFHAYLQHVRLFYNDTNVHNLVSVPGVGHSGCGMFQSARFAAIALTPSRDASEPFELVHV